MCPTASKIILKWVFPAMANDVELKGWIIGICAKMKNVFDILPLMVVPDFPKFCRQIGIDSNEIDQNMLDEAFFHISLLILRKIRNLTLLWRIEHNLLTLWDILRPVFRTKISKKMLFAAWPIFEESSLNKLPNECRHMPFSDLLEFVSQFFQN